jgi:hypothetical protein
MSGLADRPHELKRLSLCTSGQWELQLLRRFVKRCGAVAEAAMAYQPAEGVEYQPTGSPVRPIALGLCNLRLTKLHSKAKAGLAGAWHHLSSKN